MPLFSVVEMADDQFDSAFALVRMLTPELSLEQWLAYVETLRRRGGLLGLAAVDGSLFGFLTWRKERQLHRGCVLCIDNFVTFELDAAAPGRRALCEAAEALARRKGCAAIEYRQGSRGYVDSRSAKTKGWVSLGHELDSVVFIKPLVVHGAAMHG